MDLGRFATLQRGYDLPYRARKPGSIPVVTSSGVSDTHNEARASGPGVVTGRYGTIGEVFFVQDDYWPHNTTLFVSDFHGNDPLFVSYLLRTIDFQSHSGKSGVPGVNRNDLHALTVRVPPTLTEQRAIAGALSDVDGLIGKLDQLIAKQRDLKRAAMQQLLRGQKRLPGFRGEWESQTIEQLEKAKRVRLFRGKVISKRHVERTPGDYPIYSSSVKSDGVFGSYGEFMFDEELITWSIDGGGDFFYRLKHKFSVTNVCGFMRVDTGKISYRFLAAQLQLLHSRKSFDYLMKAHPSVIRKAYEVQLPKIEEQIAITEVLSDMDEEITALEERRDKTLALKQGMMQELLTGRVRLI
ncbi:MAG: restriction endonuclease subunit S [Ignavibacteriales bacterium]|nr:restriction endonuclease subunit S [Ignavibacteriales bacterium]